METVVKGSPSDKLNSLISLHILFCSVLNLFLFLVKKGGEACNPQNTIHTMGLTATCCEAAFLQ